MAPIQVSACFFGEYSTPQSRHLYFSMSFYGYFSSKVDGGFY